MFKITLALLLLCTFTTSCSSTEKKPKPAVTEHPVGDFPGLISLSAEKKNTAFATTLESKTDPAKNTIYAATLLFCWNKFEKDYGPSTNISKAGLKELTNSRCFRNTLKANEYTTALEAMGNTVKITSVFDMQLPFRKPMDESVGEFKGEKVLTFGSRGKNAQIEIIYYYSDTDFAIRLLPENQQHEIMICQGDFSGLTSLKQHFLLISSKEKQFKAGAKDWMRRLNKDDEVSIPKLEFNLDTHYQTIEGARFNTPRSGWTVLEAYQQNALVMNEKGVAAYSKAVVRMIATCAMPQEEVVKVPEKHLNINSDYVVFFKRKECNWPYFGAFIANSRWMKSK